MKYVLAIAALLLSHSVPAQEATRIVWDVSGVSDSGFPGNRPIEIALDTRWSTYGSANGTVVVEGDIGVNAVGATGTCFFIDFGIEISCELAVFDLQYTLIVDSNTGDGGLFVSRGLNILDEGLVTLRSID